MLICTNDGFSIVHDAPLPAEVGQIATFYSDAYDAGTEVNTESFADLVPPCQGLVGVSGEADLDAMSHAVASNPALVVVERIS
jgi:hypothetical protein